MSLVGKIIYVLSPHKWGSQEYEEVLGSGQFIQPLPPECSGLPPSDKPVVFRCFASGSISYRPNVIVSGALMSGSIGSGQIQAVRILSGGISCF